MRLEVRADAHSAVERSNRGLYARFTREHVRQLLRWAAVVVSVAAFTGCAITPESKRSLAAYVQASNEAEEAASVFLADFADSLQIESEINRVVNGPVVAKPAEDFPSEFKPPGTVAAEPTEAEKALASSRQALGVVREYNQALVALAEGRPVGVVKAQIEQLGGSVSALAQFAGFAAPGIGQFAAIGARIIQLTEDARNLQQLREAVAGGRGPVGEILDVFEAQTGPLYRSSVAVAKPAQVEVRKAIARTAFPMKTFLKRYSPPTKDDLFKNVAKVQQEMTLIGERTRTGKSLPNPFPFDSAKPVYDGVAHGEMNVFMSALRINDAKYVEIVSKQNAYYVLMGRYVDLLRQMRGALGALEQSLSAPVDLQGQVNRLLKSAFDLRDAMREFRNPSVSPS